MEDEVFIMSRVQDEEHCVPDGIWILHLLCIMHYISSTAPYVILYFVN